MARLRPQLLVAALLLAALHPALAAGERLKELKKKENDEEEEE